MHPVSHEAPINSPTRFPNFILGGLSTKVQVTGQVTPSTYISPSSTTPPCWTGQLFDLFLESALIATICLPLPRIPYVDPSPKQSWPQLRYTATRLQCLLGRGVKGSSPFTNPSSLHHGFPDKLQHCNGSCWQDCLR
ncbi:hypothetical protein CBS147332_5220 [Penicillium roqueforti]|nr:hypothetical protein CBS147332_5220 [Penicillium roqueforti]KAI3119184.1 hypothetical protein CBS147331_2596 [Penicillium roqueforti]